MRYLSLQSICFVLLGSRCGHTSVVTVTVTFLVTGETSLEHLGGSFSRDGRLGNLPHPAWPLLESPSSGKTFSASLWGCHPVLGAQLVAGGGCDGVGGSQSFFLHHSFSVSKNLSLLTQRPKHLVFSREEPNLLQGRSRSSPGKLCAVHPVLDTLKTKR